MRPIVVLLATAISASVLACDRLPGRPDPADRYRYPSEIMDFATLYGTNCAGCHGAQGRQGPARPLSDPVYLALVDAQYIAETASRGMAGTAMPAFARSHGGMLEEAQLKAIAAGIFQRWSDPGQLAGVALPPYSEADSRAAGHAPGDANRGARAYGEFCAECHGEDGQGGEEAGPVVDPNLLALVSDQMLRTTVIAGRPDLGMPDWREHSKQGAMTPQEISDLVAWLAVQRGRAPGQAHATSDAVGLER